MIVPKPPVDLEGHCSVIHANTLYTYSEHGFASIPLQRNGNWTTLPSGEPVSKAACVTGGVDGDNAHQALYVIGGTGSKKKPGLQRYSFKNNEWKSFEVADRNMANRTRHHAVYLKSSNSILVYGGHQEDLSVASSDTFVIRTTKPFTVDAFVSNGAPPAQSPQLVNWDDKQAALVGGDTTPKGVHLFDPKQGWHKSKITLPQSLSDDVECALVRGSDGSKVLEAFDMSKSPNTVTNYVLAKAGGKPMSPAKTIGGSSAKTGRRDITLNGYPTYNSDFASSTKRKDYSFAQGDNNLVVFSSGQSTDSLAIFNQTSNGWVNATKLFYGDESSQQILATATGSSPTSSSTSTDSSSSTPTSDGAPFFPTVDPSSGHASKGTIIGATLGSIFGVAAILLLALFFLKRKKNEKKRAGLTPDSDKDGRLSFQDQGVEPLARSAYPMAESPAPQASTDSLAIFAGKFGSDEKSPRSAGSRPQTQKGPKPSPLNNVQSSRDVQSPELDQSNTEDMSGGGGRPGDRTTDEGWSKYFQGNSATSLVGEQRSTANGGTTNPETRQSAWPMSNLTPLNFGFLDGPKPLGRVVSGSPTTEHSPSNKEGQHIAIPESQSARISSADSLSMASDDYEQERRDDLRESKWHQRSWIGRPPSSLYTASLYNRSSAHVPSQTPSEYRPYETTARASTNTRGSSVLIPDTLEPMPTRNNMNTDMSWLNLNSER